MSNKSVIDLGASLGYRLQVVYSQCRVVPRGEGPTEGGGAGTPRLAAPHKFLGILVSSQFDYASFCAKSPSPQEPSPEG